MPDFDLPGRYLRENFERLDRLAVVLIHRGTDGRPDHVQQKFATAEHIAAPRFQPHLRAANATGSDVYISMNTIASDAQGRTKADVEMIRHIYLDVDIGGGDAVNRILSTPGMPNPHHVLIPHQASIRSSGRSKVSTRVRPRMCYADSPPPIRPTPP